MKSTIKLLAASTLAFVGFALQAQKIPLRLERELLLNAYNIIDSYEYSASLRDGDAAYTFKKLFADPKTSIYNDLLGLSDADVLPLDVYIDLMRNEAVSPSVKLKNIRRKSIKDEGNNIVLVLDLDKEIRYNNHCGAILSSNTYYEGKDYALEMEIVMDKSTGECMIRSINGSVDSNQPRLDRDFAIIELNDKRDREVTNNKAKLNFNVFNQAFVPMPLNLNYPDADENMKVENIGDPSCNTYKFAYYPVRWSVKPHVNISLGDSYSIEDIPTLMDSKASTMEYGIDFGYTVPMRSKFRVSIFTGIGFATGKIDLSIASLNYHYNAPASADQDGDTYVRYYDLSDLHQSVSLMHLVLPVYADFEYRFSKRISAFVQLGIKTYFNMGSKVNDFSGTMYSYGIYPQYNNLMIDAEYMNNFGTSTISESAANNMEFKGASFDALIGAGLRAKIYGPLSIEASVNYQIGLTEVVGTSSNHATMSSGSILESQAFASYTVSEGTRLHLLSDYLGGIKRNPLKLNVGLIFKF